MGLIIDHFGLLHTSVRQFGLLRAVSLLLILAGVMMVIIRRVEKGRRGKGLLMWQITGFSGGVIYVMQPPMNSLLESNLASAIYAALITFVTATILLMVIVICW